MNDEKYFDGFYAINDGYGIVGHGFQCPHCSKNNTFIDEEDNLQECEYCREVSVNKPEFHPQQTSLGEANDWEIMEEGEEW